MNETREYRILLVEPAAETSAAVKCALETEGYRVVTATDGESAAALVREDPARFDLMITEIDLGPGLDGIGTAREVLKTHDIPVVFLSVHTEPGTIRKTEQVSSYGMGVLYDMLYCSESAGAVSAREYFSALIEKIVEIFPQKELVKIVTEIADLELSARLLCPLGIIVNELVTNAMKYAFAARTGGLLSITLSANDSRVVLTCSDDGPGLPDTAETDSAGFGLQLVKILALQLRGNLVIEKGQGTTFMIEFSSETVPDRPEPGT